METSGLACRRMTTMGRIHLLLPVLLTGVLASGCILLEGRAQRKQQETFAVIEGSVTTDFDSSNGLVVVLARIPDGVAPQEAKAELVDHYVLRGPGRWRFGVAPGSYAIAAFEDTNGDGHYEDEPAIVPRRPDGSIREELLLVDVKPGERRVRDLVISREGRSARSERVDIVGEIAAVRSYGAQEIVTLGLFEVVGEVISLDDPRFDLKNGEKGLWKRVDFIMDLGPGVYFLEEYDREKVPVLFVHGISGSPRHFEDLIEGLDRDRFQPWVYFYPSGFNLDGLANFLTQQMTKLQQRHGFDQFVVVAHSMGGLVSRAFLLKHEELGGDGDVPLFVSMASPWGGASAAASIESAPASLRDNLPPVFEDMAPDSLFNAGLFYQDPETRKTRRGLPKGTKYHLWFAREDQTVPSESSLIFPVQEDAGWRLRAIPGGHVDILKHERTSEFLNEVLGEID